jgi:hypothetical protein
MIFMEASLFDPGLGSGPVKYALLVGSDRDAHSGCEISA